MSRPNWIRSAPRRMKSAADSAEAVSISARSLTEKADAVPRTAHNARSPRIAPPRWNPIRCSGCKRFSAACNGLLSHDQFVKLLGAGATRYHCSLESSRRRFPNAAPPVLMRGRSRRFKTWSARALRPAAAGSSALAKHRKRKNQMIDQKYFREYNLFFRHLNNRQQRKCPFDSCHWGIFHL